MDFDSAYIDPLLDEWLIFLQEKTKEQEQIILEDNKFLAPYIGLHVNVVKLIFSIADQFELNANAKYLAIHLYDKYMNCRSCEAYEAATKSANTKACWEQEQKKINSEAKLRLLSCIQLGSKMDSNVNCLRIPDVQKALSQIDSDRNYSKKTILESEFHVFEAVKFEMPLSTPKNCVDVLLAASGIRNTPGVLESSSDLLDLSYMCHEELYSYLKTMTQDGTPTKFFDQKSALIIESNALFLGASIALASVFFTNPERKGSKELLRNIATLVGLKETDIWDMANLLFSLAVQA